ncbi:integrase [Rhodoligotrophos appendicifer]|uniref:tyrosine-type recombinase/integrase n=1 Tax=Rhodoligotrophos appendicifer TaxID=987056 RepID=UPI001185774C|nr:integrase family protein [Rhodoligotrophos appendicifer]
MPKIHFTKSAIEGLPVPENRIAYTDDKAAGLELLITAGGTKTFYLRRRVRGTGRMERIKLGRFPALSVEAARRSAAKHAGTMEEGKSVVAEMRGKRASTQTLRQTLEAYIAHRQRNHEMKQRTAADYRDVIELHSGDWLDRPLSTLTREEFERKYNLIRQRTTGEKTGGSVTWVIVRGGEGVARSWARVMRAVMNYAVDHLTDPDGRPLLLANPVAAACRRLAVSRIVRRETFISEDRFGAWLDALDADRVLNPVAADYLEVLTFTGLRRNEAAGLRTEDVNRDAATLTIRETKNGRPHVLPFGPHLLSIFERRVAAAHAFRSEWLFPAARGEGHFVAPGKAVRRIGARAGVPSVRCHDLRRTFATVADAVGVGMFTLKRLMNHLSGDVTFGYVGADVERMREPMVKIETRILEKAGRNPRSAAEAAE